MKLLSHHVLQDRRDASAKMQIPHNMSSPTSMHHRRPHAPQPTDNPPPPATKELLDTSADEDLPTRPYSSPRLRNVLLFCIAFRSVLGIVGQRTFFQPDEFYQSLEPAHRMVWGTGYETWEWRESFLGEIESLAFKKDLAGSHSSHPLDGDLASMGHPGTFADGWRTRLRNHIIRSTRLKQLLLGLSSKGDTPEDSGRTARRPLNGLLRSWVWPLLFAFPYWILKVTGTDKVGTLLVSVSH